MRGASQRAERSGFPTDIEPSAPVTLTGAGLQIIVDALDAAAVIVERHGGEVLWASRRWRDRFGEHGTWAKHMPSTVSTGESPLPGPGDTWQRTRTLRIAGTGDDLVELLLMGERAPNGTEIVAIIAPDRTGSGAAVSDRSEVNAIVDRLLDAADEQSAVPNASDLGPRRADNGGLAVLYVDLDRFKVVHDLVGTVETVRLLDVVSRRLAAAIGPDDLLFRLPSDEFVIVASAVAAPGAASEIAERLRMAVATMSDIGHDLALTASIGVAIADGQMSGDGLVSAAETAVYLAKGRGRNRVAVHDEELRSRTERHMVVERHLRTAIEHRDVSFAYQPVVDLHTGATIGAEALLRVGGDLGLSAVQVVAAAEHSGLMGAIGSLVLQGVQDQLGDLLADPERALTVMINLAATQLADVTLLGTLDAIVGDDRLAPGRIGIEVPEVVVRDSPDAFRALTERVRPNVAVGIDGFGTNLSSLGLLSSFSIDYVKIHRALTTTSTVSAESQMQIAEVVNLSQHQGVEVIALGVERREHATAMAELGCQVAQGFYFAGALTRDELIAMVERTGARNGPAM